MNLCNYFFCTLSNIVSNTTQKVGRVLSIFTDLPNVKCSVTSLKTISSFTMRADQRKTAMYRGSNRIQIAARVNIMHPKKFGDHHRDENMDYRRDGGVQKGNCDNYLHLAIHFSGQYPRAKIFCTRMFYFPVTH